MNTDTWLVYDGLLASGAERGKPFEYRYRDDGAVEIRLTQNQIAVIDADDLELVRGYSWYALWSPDPQCFYAVTNGPRGDDGQQETGIYMHRLILGRALGDSRRAEYGRNSTLDNRRSSLVRS